MLVENSNISTGAVKKRIIKDNILEYKCDTCGISDWNNDHLVLELDHINGVNNDHRLTNLRFLCPNCHSQTSTFRGRNKNTGVKKITDEQMIDQFNNSKNIRQTLISLGLAPKGGNYERVKKLTNENR